MQIKHHYHHHHQSLNRDGRWGTTDDFAKDTTILVKTNRKVCVFVCVCACVRAHVYVCVCGEGKRT